MRSAVSSGRASPSTTAITVPGWQNDAVAVVHGEHDRRIELAEDLGGDVEPGDDARRLGQERAAAARLGRHGGVGGDVAPAEVLGQRAPDRLAVVRRIERAERLRLHAGRSRPARRAAAPASA